MAAVAALAAVAVEQLRVCLRSVQQQHWQQRRRRRPRRQQQQALLSCFGSYSWITDTTGGNSSVVAVCSHSTVIVQCLCSCIVSAPQLARRASALHLLQNMLVGHRL